ncbi:hypothetical protein [Sinimarinibacterium flocculans]|uniref:hypothetical protein n=1 Tax=Sinimarinibacterium flocculans TaxID=985250 RepID=UPI0035157BB3
MDEVIKVTFFKVNYCGYFPRKSDTPAFGSLSDTISDLCQWASTQGKTLQDTCITEPPADSPFMRTFCLDAAAGKGGDYLLATWNEIAHDNGAVAAINVTEPVGDAAMQTATVGQGFVPGYPSYFWIDPSRDLIANIRFETEHLSGRAAAWNYIEQFMRLCSKHAHVSDDDEDADHAVYRFVHPATSKPGTYYPRLKVVQHCNPQQLERIRNMRHRIRRVIHKAVMRSSSEDESTIIDKMMLRFGLTDPPKATAPIRCKYALDMQPSAEELEQIIARWYEHAGDGWEDIGFEYTENNKSEVHWLGSGDRQFELKIDVTRGVKGTFAAESVLNAIHARQALFLSQYRE